MRYELRLNDWTLANGRKVRVYVPESAFYPFRRLRLDPPPGQQRSRSNSLKEPEDAEGDWMQDELEGMQRPGGFGRLQPAIGKRATISLLGSPEELERQSELEQSRTGILPFLKSFFG